MNDSDEMEALRAQVAELERTLTDRTARANAAIAAAQDRSYWLDRWHVDLNALMRKRGAAEARAAFRALRAVYRTVNDRRKDAGLRLQSARMELAEERERGSGTGAQPEDLGRSISPTPLRASPVTDSLYGRLQETDIEAIRERLEPAEAALWETSDATDRRRLALAFAAHHGVQPALERSGLSADMPTADVHSMARGAAAAAGSTYYADLVVDALARSGLSPHEGQSWLDFGCSSGRVVRVLGTAFDGVDWHGCDPLPDAIEWASEHLGGIRFERSPEYPPLPYAEASFDVVYAISIWSHFSEPAAIAWLGEMRRVIKPGGRLLLTTHGGQTIAHTRRSGERSAEQLAAVRAALYERGFWYAPEFGEQGDHGIANPDWGTAFLSSEWLLAHLTPDWHVAVFGPGRVEDNQDLYVLTRQ